MQLIARRQRRGDAVVVSFKGEVDLAVASEFKSHLKAGLDEASSQPGRLLIIDLQDVTFFASSGMHALVSCRDQGTNDGIPVGLVSSSAAVVRVIKATRLDEILTLYPTIDDALNALKPPDSIKPN
jgi:anti-sigma B factor antagonist